MKKKNIAIFTVARSDYGLLKKIILEAEKDKRFNLYLVIGSAHKSKIFGRTINETKEIKVKNKIKFNFKYKDSKKKDIINYFQKTMIESSNFFNNQNIDASIILGDRYEMLAISIASINHNVPIMHFCGGSETLGSLDNIYRYSISKMAAAHFLETNYHKNNLKKIGIKKNLFVVGAPGVENINKRFNKKKKLGFVYKNKKKIIVACFHPETTKTKALNKKNIATLLKFLSKIDEQIIFTYPNADLGFKDYIKLIKKYLKNKKNTSIVQNLGILKYHNLLSHSDLLIGNSSSGIIEGASFKIPVINVGDRQKKRFADRNVLHAKFEAASLQKCYKKAISSKFISGLCTLKSIYYKKNTAQNSLNIIYNKLNEFK
tara:strand:+ start:1094 stop:2215 length:1122 start_codon:yes stop_codon:yes gene_type:complete